MSAPTRVPLGTPTEVAEFLNTTPAKLAQDRHLNRGIPYLKHGKSVRYRWSDVDAYIDANTHSPDAA